MEAATRSPLLPDSGALSLRHRVVWISWIALLILLPITSQPHLAQVMGGGPVSPPAVLPAALVFGLGVLPYLAAGGRVPRVVFPLLLFCIVALVATLLAPWRGVLPFKGQDVIDRGFRGIFTLGIGLTYYAAAVLVPSDERKARLSLVAIAAGALPMLIWSTVQLARLPYANDPVPVGLDRIHELFSLRPLFRDRITGLAYEPSWMADQLVLLYLPIWTAMVARGVTAFRFRWRWVTVEAVLLAWGGVIFLGTFSRIGIMAWSSVIVVLAVAGGWKAGGWLHSRRSRVSSKATVGHRRRLMGVAMALAAALVMLFLVAGVVFLASRYDERIAKVFRIEAADLLDSRHPAAYLLANRLEMAERVVYWESAARVFAIHPVLGVGLGETGFFLPQVAHAFGYKLPEILDAVDPGSPVFPNPKSMWFRLPAETGLVGTALYLTWLVVTAAAAWEVRTHRKSIAGALGLAALLALTALVLEGLSLDTFALPYLWIVLGMASAGWWSQTSLGGRREA